MSNKASGWAMEQEGLNPTLKLILIMMGDAAGKGGKAHCSNTTMCRLTGFSKDQTISDAQKQLCEKGILFDTGERIGRTSKVKVFQFPLEACSEAPDASGMAALGNPPLNGSLSNPPLIPRQSPANPPFDGKPPYTNRTIELGTVELVEIPESLRTEEFTAVWQTWIECRREQKKPMTKRSAEMQLSDMAAWGVEKAITAMKNSIRNGYQGLFEPSNGFKAKNTPPSREMTPEEREAELRVEDVL